MPGNPRGQRYAKSADRTWSLFVPVRAAFHGGLPRRGREMEGGAGVHGHGDAESLGNFLFGAAGFKAGIGVEGAAVVATRSDGPTDGDELHFFANKGAFEVRSGKGLIVLRESGQSLGNSEMDLASSAC